MIKRTEEEICNKANQIVKLLDNFQEKEIYPKWKYTKEELEALEE